MRGLESFTGLQVLVGEVVEPDLGCAPAGGRVAGPGEGRDVGDLQDTADGAGGSPESCGGWRAGARVCEEVPED